MNDNDPFWTLSGLEEINGQAEFFQRLQEGSTLEGVWYRPEILAKEDDRRTEIREMTFIRCRFSHTQISGIIFRNCTFKNCLLIGSNFKNCEFHRCAFKSTNTYKMSFEETYINPLSFSDCLDKNLHQNIGTHLFQGLLKNSRDEDQIEFERDARFLFLRWKRYQNWYEVRRILEELKDKSAPKCKLLIEALMESVSCFWRWAWEVTSGSGVRIGRFFVSTTVLALGWSAVNYCCRDELGLERAGKPITDYWEALYFTVVSLTTLGYGDITPSTTIGQLLASIQGVFGFIVFALLASMLFRRLFP